MNPQLPVKVNSAPLNRMQQSVLITRLSMLLLSHGVCTAPHPSRSVTTLPLLLSEIRLSPKAHGASGQEPSRVGTLRMQISEEPNWNSPQLNGQIEGEVGLASGPPRSLQHPLRGSRLFFWTTSAHKSNHLELCYKSLQICCISIFEIWEAERTNLISHWIKKKYIFKWLTISHLKHLNILFLF